MPLFDHREYMWLHLRKTCWRELQRHIQAQRRRDVSLLPGLRRLRPLLNDIGAIVSLFQQLTPSVNQLTEGRRHRRE